MTPEQSEIVRRFMAGDSLTHIQHDFRHLSRGPGAAVDLTWVPVESALRAALIENAAEIERLTKELEHLRLEYLTEAEEENSRARQKESP